jgi:pyruvate dehydrogenase E2 component (dihydrolipoamide acetyltransferase)
MANVVEMPKLSDTMEEGAVASWLKKEGDTVDEGGALCEIETDKATMEYQSPFGGVLLKIIAQPGKTMALNTPIAVIGKKGESFDLEALIAKSGAPKAPAPSTPAAKPTPVASAPKAAPAPVAPAARVAAPVAVPASAPAPTSGGRIKSSPLARRMAAASNVNLAGVAGSGPGGRIVMRDIEAAVARGGSGGGGGFAPLAPREDQTIPVTLMRKTIAKRLLAGKNDAPHFYLTLSVNMGQMLQWRQMLNDAAGESGVKVSVNDLIIFAAARALRRHPEVNASWQGENIIQYGAVHMCVAVALPTGLVTPVIRNADQLNIRDIAAASRNLAQRAKAGQLANEDYAGGTFTISNLGMFGIEEFTAIINPPQAAILAVGATIATPAVDAKGNVVVEQRMKVTMSCDHRVIDGAMGAAFLKTLTAYLEQPLMMMV